VQAVQIARLRRLIDLNKAAENGMHIGGAVPLVCLLQREKEADFGVHIHYFHLERRTSPLL